MRKAKFLAAILIVTLFLLTGLPAFAADNSSQPAQPDNTGALTKLITEAINGFMSNIIEQGLNPILDFLGRYLFSTPDITAQGGLVGIWKTIRIITNALFILVAIVGAITIASRDHLNIDAYEIRVFAPRLVWGFIVSNLSLYACSFLIELNNGLVRAVTGVGIDVKNLNLFKSIGTFSKTLAMAPFLSLIGLILLFMVAIIYTIRLGMIWVLTILSPLAFAFWVLPQTQFLMRIWSRAYISTVFVQFLHALILTVFLRLQFEGSMAEGLVSIAVLYLIVKIPKMLLQATMYSNATPSFRGSLFTVLAFQRIGRMLK